MPVESGTCSSVIYEIIESIWPRPEGETATVYGLRAVYSGVLTETVTIGDISADRAAVEQLLARLDANEVSREHLIDIVEDFVQAMAMN